MEDAYVPKVVRLSFLAKNVRYKIQTPNVDLLST